MPTKVLLVNTLEQTVQEAREYDAPRALSLLVAAPGSARATAGHSATPNT